MRMAYLILAHDEPEQLAWLIDRLVPSGSPDIAIVHADAGSDLWPLLRERWPHDTESLRLIRDPVRVRWGHWSQVAATALLVEAARDAACDYAHFISGADWPCVSREQLVAQVSGEAPPACFVEAVAGEQEERMACRRLDTRWLRLDPKHDRLAYAATWELRRLSRWMDGAADALHLHRSSPYGRWHKGSQWWSLPQEAIALLARELPLLLASGRLKGTLCSDEHVVPTIMAAHFAGRLRPNRRFIDWSAGQSSPRVLSATDLAAIKASGAWFMRKVSARHDDFFLDMGRERQESLPAA
jgi:hypothetical protein